MLKFIQSICERTYFLVELSLEADDLVILDLNILPQEFNLLLHGALLVLQVSHAIMVIFKLPFETRLATATVNVILITLGINMDLIRLTRKLLTTMWARHYCLLTIEQMVTYFLTGVFFVTVHTLSFSKYAILSYMFFKFIFLKHCFAA